MLERKAVVESFQAERSAIIQVLREERVRIIEEADRLSMTLLDKLWTMAKSLATKIGIFMTINILLILGLPFVMGIMVGKAMGLKSATKTKTSQDPL